MEDQAQQLPSQVYQRCQHHKWVQNASAIPADQGVPALRQGEEEMADIDDIPKEHPCCKQKEGRPAAKTLNEPHWETFSKESEVMKVAR